MGQSPEQFEELKSKLMGQFTELKEIVEKRDTEFRELGEVSEETKSAVQKCTTEIEQLGEQYKSHLESYEDFKSQVEDHIKKGNRPGMGAADTKSIGEMFVDSDQYDRALKQSSDNVGRVEIKNFRAQVEQYEEQKSPLQTSSGSNNALLPALLLQGIFGDPQRDFRLRDLMTVNNTTEGMVEFVEETNFYQLYTEVRSAVSATDTEIAVDNAYGFYDGQTITLGAGTANEEEVTLAASNAIDTTDGAHTITLASGCSNTHAKDVPVVAEDFVFTPETELRPKAHAKFDLEGEKMKTLTHWIPASRQVLKNKQMLRQHIDTRLFEGLSLSEEKQILYGDGSTNQLQGILTHPSAQTYLWSNGESGDTKIDAIRRAITLSQLYHFPLDGIVVHPSDWEDIELAKGSDGHYIWVTVQQGGQTRMWRAPVVVTTAINAGEFCVGAFGMAAALWDRQRATISVAEQHEDYFVKGMVAIMAEQEMTQTIYRPEAFVYGKFDDAPS